MPDVPLPEGNDQISEQQLKFGYWFVTHKLQLKKIGTIVLLVIDFALLGYGGWGLIRLYVLEADAERSLELSLATAYSSPAAHQAIQPVPLGIGTASVLAAKDKFDLVAQIQNLNPSMYATFTYRFVTQAGATAPEKGFILPGEQKYVVALGTSFSARPGSAQLELSDLQYTRIDRHKVGDYTEFAADHLGGIKISDILYDPAIILDSATVGRTTFTLKNDTGYGYYAPRFLVVQFRGGEVGSVNIATPDSLKPGESAHEEVTWFESLPAISKVLVVPDINIFDERAYLNP